MARKIHSRYKISGTLIAKSPIHVGGLGGNADTDLALAINGKGEYYIPGTSLAGALRAWMETINPKTTNYLWGFQDKNNQGESIGHASFILVEDAVIKLPENMTQEIRDGVAIDRHLGTAVERMKFDRAILPREAKIPIKLTLERETKLTEEEWQKYQSQFALLLNALQEEVISIGAATTRGLGRVKLYDLNITEEKLLERTGIQAILLNQPSSNITNQFLGDVKNAQPISPASLEIKIHWQPISSVMVKAESEGIAVDILPLVSGLDSSVTFVLPGSSIKGSLRSQAERIVRTVLQKETPIWLNSDDSSQQPEIFAQQIDLSLVNTIFGSSAKFDSEKKQLGYKSSLSVDDCFANIPIRVDDWANIENATKENRHVKDGTLENNLRDALNNANLQDTQQAFHVGIDRWTSAAADGYLYSRIEPMGFSWQPINLSLNLSRLKQNNELQDHQDNHRSKNSDTDNTQKLDLKPKNELEYYPSLTLLLLVLRDLMESKIPLGFGTNRGMGGIKVTKIEIQGKGELNELSPLSPLTLTKPDFSEISAKNQEFLTNINIQWQTWINGGELNSDRRET